MDLMTRAAAAVRGAEPASADAAFFGTVFLAELSEQLQAAETVVALEQTLSHTRSLWSPITEGHQELLDAVCWEVLSALAPHAVRSRGCYAVLADTSRDIAQSCAPREAVTILLAAMSGVDANEDVAWGLRLAAVQGLKQALPLVSRRRLETFPQVAPVLLAGLRAALDPERASLANEEATGAVAAWAREQYPGAVVALAEALCASLQPGEGELQAALGTFILHVLSISTSELPLAAPLPPGSTGLAVPPLLLSLLQLFPAAGLTVKRILSLDFEELPGAPRYDSDTSADDEPVHAEAEQGRALAAACLLCLPAPLLPCPLPALSARDAAVGVALAGVLLRGSPAVASKGLALISVAASHSQWENDEELEAAVVDGVQATLQSLTMLMLLQPDPRARQAAYAAFKASLSVLPPSARFATLDSFIATCPHQPVVTLLLHLLKEEVAQVLLLPPSTPSSSETRLRPPKAYSGARILAVVGRVLAPPSREADPLPALPEEADVVVAALNLYRFVLLREAAVGSDWTGALSAASLNHARTHWLLPLRHVVEEAATMAGCGTAAGEPHAGSSEATTQGKQSGGDCDRDNTRLMMDTVAEVLCRVLEIVEEKVQQKNAADTR